MPLEQIIRGNIEALDQGIELVGNVTDEQYTKIVTPYASSSMGAHFRHILDMFHALKNSYQTATSVVNTDALTVVDYDYRRRGAAVEDQRTVALDELKEIKSWMRVLGKNLSTFGNVGVRIKTEVTLQDTQSVELDSSIFRELIFISSHAVHHYALITVIAKLQNISVNDSIGLAPATVSYLRDLNKPDLAASE